MELFLNLCWLILLLPAYLLWRQRVLSKSSTRASFVIICTLGCGLVLLFPVISASDDLHAVGQVMEEAERGLRHSGHCACVLHSFNRTSLPALLSAGSVVIAFEQIETVRSFWSPPYEATIAEIPSGRAPPFQLAVSL